MKKMARRSFLVFLSLFFLAAAGASLVVFNSVPPDAAGSLPLTGAEGGGLFGANRVKEYEEVFSVIEQRRKDNETATMTEYPHIFRELTE